MASNRIIAIKLRSLGDTVLMTAALEGLREAFPRAEIHAAVTDPWSAVLENHPAVDKVWRYTRYRDAASRAKSIAGLALRLRRLSFDYALNFHASPSSAVLTFATGAPIRSVHFHGHKDHNRYSTVVVPGKGVLKPIIERDMDTVRALGIELPSGRLPKIYLREAERLNGEHELEKAHLTGAKLVLAIGASRPTKTWSMDRFAKLADRWVDQTGGSVAIVGAGESEKNAIQKLISGMKYPKKTAVFLDLPIRDLASLLSQCAVVVGNDSGPRHIGVSVGVPTVTLIGPEHPFEWHPYPRDRHPYLYLDNLACRRDAQPGMPAWCALTECVAEKHKCMASIGVDEVFAETLRVAAL